MTTAVVFGASGFAGNELLKLLARHPQVDTVIPVSREHAGRPVASVYPDLPTELSDLNYDSITFEKASDADVVFFAIPAVDAKEAASRITTRIVDLSPAHRFDKDFAYGLPEANRAAIRTARKIANPGCYATACLLAALPLSNRFASVAFDCKSGYSGGGKAKKYDVEENVVPYGLANHYQKPEIGKYVTRPFTFVPHVVNAFRGLEATVHVMGLDPSFVPAEGLQPLFRAHYHDEPMVRIGDDGAVPSLKAAAGTNGATIGGFACDGKNAVFVCAIDNLLKGAASQAVQNMNLMLRFNETDGLA